MEISSKIPLIKFLIFKLLIASKMPVDVNIRYCSLKFGKKRGLRKKSEGKIYKASHDGLEFPAFLFNIDLSVSMLKIKITNNHIEFRQY